MRITSAGTVGVGESSPSAALHVVHGSGITLPTMETTARNLAIFEGDQSENYISIASPNTAYAGINFTDTGHKAAGWVQYKHESTATNDFMRFAVNESERFRILAAGGIGIKGAFVNSASADPADYQISFGGDATTTPRWGFRVSGSSNEDLYLDRNLSGTPAECMIWNKSNGNTTIKGKLTIEVENETPLHIRSTSTAGGNNAYLTIENDGGADTYLNFLQGSSNGYIKYRDEGEMVFQTSGMNDRLTIDSSGSTFAGNVSITGSLWASSGIKTSVSSASKATGNYFDVFTVPNDPLKMILAHSTITGSDGPGNYNRVDLVFGAGGSYKIVNLDDTSYMNAQMSGATYQVQQTSGGTQTISTRWLIIA